jgi:hypothetical protein
MAKQKVHFHDADTSTSSEELQNDEECDATNDANRYAAGYTKKSVHSISIPRINSTKISVTPKKKGLQKILSS